MWTSVCNVRNVIVGLSSVNPVNISAITQSSELAWIELPYHLKAIQPNTWVILNNVASNFHRSARVLNFIIKNF